MNRDNIVQALGKRTTRNAWGLAAIASYLVGLRDGQIAKMATTLHYDQETVRRMGRGYLFYRILAREWMNASYLRCYPHPRVWRERLTYNHFAELAEYWHSHEIDPLALFAEIQTTYENGIGAKAMRENLDTQANGHKPEKWRYDVAQLASQAVEIQKAAFVPLHVKKLAGLVERYSAHALNGGLSNYDEYTIELFEILQPKKGEV